MSMNMTVSESLLNFPNFTPDYGKKRFDESLRKSGFKNWSEVHNLLEAATTKDEKRAIYRKLPLDIFEAVHLKREMGKEAFLAKGYNLIYVNEELGGPDWVDKL